MYSRLYNYTVYASIIFLTTLYAHGYLVPIPPSIINIIIFSYNVGIYVGLVILSNYLKSHNKSKSAKIVQIFMILFFAVCMLYAISGRNWFLDTVY